MIIGIDPGFRKIGVCFLKKDGISFRYIEIDRKIDDYAFIYRKLSDEFSYVKEADFVFLEDIIYMPKRKREIQAMLFGTIALILSKLSEDAGYYFVSPWKVKKCKTDEIENLSINEHLKDAYKVLKIGLGEMEKKPDWVLGVMEKVKSDENFEVVKIVYK